MAIHNQIEQIDPGAASGPADTSRQTLSDSAIALMHGSKSAFNSARKAEGSLMKTGEDAANVIKEISKGVESKGAEVLNNFKGGNDSICGHFFQKEVTDKDRADAKKELAKDLGDLKGLIPAADAKMLTDMQGALVDGNLSEFSKDLKALSGKPGQVEKFVKALNKELAKHGGGVSVNLDGKGDVLVYENGGNTAVDINPATGQTTLKGVERMPDGSVRMLPGEIINREPKEVMKNIGDYLTRSLEPVIIPDAEPVWKLPGGGPDRPVDPGFRRPFDPRWLRNLQDNLKKGQPLNGISSSSFGQTFDGKNGL